MIDDYSNVEFQYVIPLDYAMELKELYRNNPQRWYDSILPREMADSLMKETNNDYSLVWHVHCNECYKCIDKDGEGCYTADGIIWLCKDCYKELF